VAPDRPVPVLGRPGPFQEFQRQPVPLEEEGAQARGVDAHVAVAGGKAQDLPVEQLHGVQVAHFEAEVMQLHRD